MKLLFIILIEIFLFSCISEKQREEICAHCPASTTDTVTIKTDTVIQRDTVVQYKSFYGDTIQIQAPFFENKKAFVRERKKDGLVTKVTYKDQKLIAECDADSLKFVIARLTKTINNSKIDKSVKTNFVQVEHAETWWETLYQWYFWITAAILVLFLLWSLKVIPHP